MIFQDPYASLNPRKRVGIIVAEPLIVHDVGTETERKRRVQELLEVVGLNPEHYNRYPHEFSGGQRQRIGIARALAAGPRLDRLRRAGLRARRVGAGADPQPARATSRREFGLTYVFIAHDLTVVRHISDRVAVMYLGKLVELADSKELYAAPRHPYTGALLSAVPIANPRLGRRRERLVLAGDIPNPIDPPGACRFHPRCPRSQELCSVEDPQLLRIAPPSARETACHFPLERWPLTPDEMRAPDGVLPGPDPGTRSFPLRTGRCRDRPWSPDDHGRHRRPRCGRRARRAARCARRGDVRCSRGVGRAPARRLTRVRRGCGQRNAVSVEAHARAQARCSGRLGEHGRRHLGGRACSSAPASFSCSPESSSTRRHPSDGDPTSARAVPARMRDCGPLSISTASSTNSERCSYGAILRAVRSVRSGLPRWRPSRLFCARHPSSP